MEINDIIYKFPDKENKSLKINPNNAIIDTIMDIDNINLSSLKNKQN